MPNLQSALGSRLKLNWAGNVSPSTLVDAQGRSNATQATAARQPKILSKSGSSIVSWNPEGTFGANADVMVAAASGASATPQFTFFGTNLYVTSGYANDGTGFQDILDINGRAILYISTADNLLRVGGLGSNPLAVSNSPINIDTWLQVMGMIDTSGGGLGTLWINKVAQTQMTPASDGLGVDLSTNAITIGANDTSGNVGFQGFTGNMFVAQDTADFTSSVGDVHLALLAYINGEATFRRSVAPYRRGPRRFFPATRLIGAVTTAITEVFPAATAFTWTAADPTVQVAVSSSAPSDTWSALAPSATAVASTTAPSDTWTALAPTVEVDVSTPAPSDTWTALAPTITVTVSTAAPSETWTARTPAAEVDATATAATLSWSALDAPGVAVATTTAPSDTWTALAPTVQAAPSTTAPSETWTALDAAGVGTASTSAPSDTWTALDPVAALTVATTPPSDTWTALAAPGVAVATTTAPSDTWTALAPTVLVAVSPAPPIEVWTALDAEPDIPTAIATPAVFTWLAMAATVAISVSTTPPIAAWTVPAPTVQASASSTPPTETWSPTSPTVQVAVSTIAASVTWSVSAPTPELLGATVAPSLTWAALDPTTAIVVSSPRVAVQHGRFSIRAVESGSLVSVRAVQRGRIARTIVFRGLVFEV